jgi:hypothetical protein
MKDALRMKSTAQLRRNIGFPIPIVSDLRHYENSSRFILEFAGILLKPDLLDTLLALNRRRFA